MEENNIYPNLHDQQLPSDSFRLQQISEIKKFFENEIEFRRSIYSKYKKAFNVINGIIHSLNIVSVASGSVTITSLAGIITAPVAIGLGGVTIAGALLSTGLSVKKKDILKKIEKHEKISTTAISKLNTINDLVSKALTDSKISPEEFTLILQEKEKYLALKNSIRKKQRESDRNIDVETLKKNFLEEGKKLAQTEMLEKLKSQQ